MADYYVDPLAAGNNDGGGDGAANDPTDANNWTDAWVSLQSAADAVVAGDIVYCRGTQTIAAAIDFDTAAATGSLTAGYVKFIGCNATTGAIDGSRFKLDPGTADIHCISATGAMDYVWLENIEIDGYASATTKDGINLITGTSTGWVLVNVSIHGCSRHGFNDTSSYGTDWIFYRCCMYSNGGAGINNIGSTSKCLFTAVYDNTGDGITLCYGLILGSLIYDNGDDGIEYVRGTVIHSCIDANGDDGVFVHASSSTSCCLMGCRITNHNGANGVGINANSRLGVIGYNVLDNNVDNIGSDTYVQLIRIAGGTTDSNEYYSENAGEAEGTLQGYTSNADYNLTSTADLRRDVITIPLT